ncbi:MAG: hypothetical protein NC131_10800 [Roseburia sp.]|nr:hypothetical protein [Roseburia sp.]
MTNYSVKIGYVTGTEDVKMVRAGSLKEAWIKVINREMYGRPVTAIKHIEIVPVLETY